MQDSVVGFLWMLWTKNILHWLVWVLAWLYVSKADFHFSFFFLLYYKIDDYLYL